MKWKTHTLRKYQEGAESLAGRCFRCFRHDVTAQEAYSTSSGTHDRGLGSEGTSSSLHCSTSRAIGVFRSFLLCHSATAHMQWRIVWVRQRNHTYLPRAVTGWSEREWKQNFRVSRATFHVRSCDLFWNGTKLSEHLFLWSIESRYVSKGWAPTVNWVSSATYSELDARWNPACTALQQLLWMALHSVPPRAVVAESFCLTTWPAKLQSPCCSKSVHVLPFLTCL